MPVPLGINVLLHEDRIQSLASVNVCVRIKEITVERTENTEIVAFFGLPGFEQRPKRPPAFIAVNILTFLEKRREINFFLGRQKGRHGLQE